MGGPYPMRAEVDYPAMRVPVGPTKLNPGMYRVQPGMAKGGSRSIPGGAVTDCHGPGNKRLTNVGPTVGAGRRRRGSQHAGLSAALPEATTQIEGRQGRACPHLKSALAKLDPPARNTVFENCRSRFSLY